MTAVNSAGESGYSDPATATTQDMPPVVVASATETTVTGTTTTLNAQATDVGGAGDLTYEWSVVSAPQNASASFDDETAVSPNVTFTAAGPYEFSVTVTDADGVSTTSDTVQVTVQQTLASIAVTPGSICVLPNGTCQFSATAYDQFGAQMANQPNFSWSLLDIFGVSVNSPAAGPPEIVGHVSQSGYFQAPTENGGRYFVTASADGILGESNAVAIWPEFVQVTGPVTSHSGTTYQVISSSLAVSNTGWIQTGPTDVVAAPADAVVASLTGSVTLQWTSTSGDTCTEIIAFGPTPPSSDPTGPPTYSFSYDWATYGESTNSCEYDPNTSSCTVSLLLAGSYDSPTPVPSNPDATYLNVTVKVAALEGLTVTDHNDPTNKVTAVPVGPEYVYGDPPILPPVGSDTLYVPADANGNAEVNIAAAFLSTNNRAEMCWDVEEGTKTILSGTFANSGSATDIPLHGFGDYVIDAYDSNNPSDKLTVDVNVFTFNSLTVSQYNDPSNDVTTTNSNTPSLCVEPDVNGNLDLNLTTVFGSMAAGTGKWVDYEIMQGSSILRKGNLSDSNTLTDIQINANGSTAPIQLVVFLDANGDSQPSSGEKEVKVNIDSVAINLSAPTMAAAGVGAPWKATFSFTGKVTGYLIQKVTDDWAYTLEGDNFLGSSTTRTNKWMPERFPFPYMTNNRFSGTTATKPLVYYEVWFVKDGVAYTDPEYTTPAPYDDFSPSIPTQKLLGCKYYQSAELRWVTADNDNWSLANVVGSFTKPIAGEGGPWAGLYYSIQAPNAWKAGANVASRAWGYNMAEPSNDVPALPRVTTLKDGGTGWTVSGSYNVLKPKSD